VNADTLTWLLTHWDSLFGLLSMLGAVAVLWLPTKFPRRSEVEAQHALLQQRILHLEERLNIYDRHVREVGSKLNVIDERLKGVDEKIGYRLNALDNQVTILLRGHLEWEEK